MGMAMMGVGANKNIKKLKKYVVYSSDGYGYDGWHSYAGPPENKFDSSWDTKEQANARAAYLFHACNPWGIEVNELMESEIDSAVHSGLASYCTTPDDSTTWTVKVVTGIKNFSCLQTTHDDDDDDDEYCGMIMSGM